MSSSSEGGPDGFTLVVFDALSGRRFTNLGLRPTSTVSELAHTLATVAGIAAKQQILLYGPPYARLDPRRPLVSTAGKQVFLFNRALLGRSEVTIEPVQVTPEEIDIPSSPPSSMMVQDESNPVVHALASFDRNFLFDDHKAKVYRDGAAERLAFVQDVAAAVEVQIRALDAARGNLKDHAKALGKSHALFKSQFDEQQAAQAELLECAEEDLMKLAETQLHPALRRGERATLLDCVPADKLRKWAKRCGVSHASLRNKVDRLSQLIKGMREGVETELSQPLLGDQERQRVRNAVVRANDLAAAQAKLATIVEGDRGKAEVEIRDTTSRLSTSATASTYGFQTCAKLEEWRHRHQTTELPALVNNDQELLKQQRLVADVNTALKRELVRRLRAVSELQSQIRYQGNRLAMLKEHATAQQSAVGELLHVKCMPSAYRACIQEVKLRQQYFRAYVAKVDKEAEGLYRACEEETQRREAFLRKHGVHLPRDLIAGLNERPLPAEIRAREFDAAIRQLDMSSSSSVDGEDGDGERKGAEVGSEGGGESKTKPTVTAGTGSLLMTATPVWNKAGGSDQAELERLRLENAKLKAQLASVEAASIAQFEQLHYHVHMSSPRNSASGLTPHSPRSPTVRTTPHHRPRGGISSSMLPNSMLSPRLRDASATAPVTGDGVTAHGGSPTTGTAAADARASAGAGPGAGAGAGAVAVAVDGDHVTAATEATAGEHGSKPSPSRIMSSSASELDIASVLRVVYDRVSRANLDDFDWTQPRLTRTDNSSLSGTNESLGVSLTSPAEVSGPADGEGGGGGGDGDGSSINVGASDGVSEHKNATPRPSASMQSHERGGATLSSSATVTALNRLLATHEHMRESLKTLRARLHRRDKQLMSRIAFRNFARGDIAMFVPIRTPDGGTSYIAFNERTPHHYLSKDTVESLRFRGKYPDYLLAKIVLIEPHRASSEYNPYHLKPNTKFYLLTVERLFGRPRGRRKKHDTGAEAATSNGD